MALPTGKALVLYLAVLRVLWQESYITMDMSQQEITDVVEDITNSPDMIGRIANITDLSFVEVREATWELSKCLNDTFSKNDTKQFWICLQPNAVQCSDQITAVVEWQTLCVLLLLAISVVFIICMSFAKKRKHKTACCYGRPGLLVPINMLDSYEDRFGSALAFGAVASFCFNRLFFNDTTSPKYQAVLLEFLQALVIGLIAYPLLVCIKTKHKRTGSGFGILYCSLWFGIECKILSLMVSFDCYKLVAAKYVFMKLPMLVCTFLLLLKFTRRFIKILRKGLNCNMDSRIRYDRFREKHMFKYTRSLLKKGPIGLETEERFFLAKLRALLYKWNPSFKFSTKVVCTFTVSGIAVYYISVLMLFYINEIYNLLSQYHGHSDLTDFMTHSIVSCWVVAWVLSIVRSTVVLISMMKLCREHQMRLRRGDRSWLPNCFARLDDAPVTLVFSSMKYAGYQIALGLFAYLLFGLILFVFLWLLVFAFYYKAILLKALEAYGPLVLVLFLIWLVQIIAVKYFFLQQRGKEAFIDNRNAFHITSYMLFFVNIFIGIFSALLRLSIGLCLGLFFFERAQKSLLPRWSERFDKGYRCYVGFLLVEHRHSNPILRTFSYFLIKHIGEANHGPGESSFGFSVLEFRDENVHGEIRSKGRIIARNRWNVAYTLLKNPSLAVYRKRNRPFLVSGVTPKVI